MLIVGTCLDPTTWELSAQGTFGKVVLTATTLTETMAIGAGGCKIEGKCLDQDNKRDG
jgi:hypothetical protein